MFKKRHKFHKPRSVDADVTPQETISREPKQELTRRVSVHGTLKVDPGNASQASAVVSQALENAYGQKDVEVYTQRHNDHDHVQFTTTLVVAGKAENSDVYLKIAGKLNDFPEKSALRHGAIDRDLVLKVTAV